MGRHKYDSHRPAFGRANGSLLDPSLRRQTQPTEDSKLSATMGEGVLDVAKNIAKRVGAKAANKLARESGRKIGEKIVGQTLGGPTPVARDARPPAKPTEGPARRGPKARAEAAPPRPLPSSKTVNDWRTEEVAGDRIREILEANPLKQKKTSPADAGPKARAGAQPPRSLGRAQDVSNKANEVISRLLADDD